MWKLLAGFVVFVAFGALSLFAILTAGDQVDMGGEKHGIDATHAPTSTAAPAAPADRH